MLEFEQEINLVCDNNNNNYSQNDLDGFSFSPKNNEMNLDNPLFSNNKNELYFLSPDFKKKITNYKVNKNECYNVNNIISPFSKNEANNDELLFNFYSFEKIKEIFSKNEKFIQINQKFQKNENIKEAELKLCKRKRYAYGCRYKYDYLNIKTENKTENKIEDKKEETKIKRGRKATNNRNGKEHNKMSSDNIIKKIKAKLFMYLLIFLNNMINKSNEKKNRLYKLDYKFITQLNKNIDIKYLKMPLKDLFSLDISTRYTKMSPDKNQQLIQKIINHKVYVEDYDTVIFVFNMTFMEWLELFTCKKDINDLKNQYKQYNNINFEKIGENIVCVDNLLGNILEDKKQKKEENYFSSFIFYIYNYERWFAVKSSRTRKIKNN
jgi:hypothetical protein